MYSRQRTSVILPHLGSPGRLECREVVVLVGEAAAEVVGVGAMGMGIHLRGHNLRKRSRSFGTHLENPNPIDGCSIALR